MINTNKKMPSITDLERAERIREVMEMLDEANKKYPVIVEGKKDARALRDLEITGDIITFHRGKSLYEFCEDIADSFTNVVVLMDWDTQGETLQKSITENLKGHWETHANIRELLKILCQKDVNDIEGIPKLLLRLEGMRPAEIEGLE
jgi:5S rRNA maturation endonuclease (ribonuclease M5)